MNPIVQHGSWWWPADDVDARPVIEGDCAPAIRTLLPHIIGRETIVQAGANVGLYPVALVKHFKHVYTAEPDPTNFQCLKRNLEGREGAERIAALHAAFGEKLGECAPLVVQERNCGAHRVNFGTGTIPVWTIDDLELDACDAIWLDIEGAELPALKGAVQTIDKFHPTIACEDKGLGEAYGVGKGAIQKWLGLRGYEQVARIGNDSVFRRPA